MDMKDRSGTIRVRFYSGYKGEETPRSVLIQDKEFPIERILERQKILDPKTREVRNEYTIELKGKKFILKIFISGECELVDLP
jgi:hypothetical protein